MFRVQNRYLCNTVGISAKGFSSLDLMIQVSGFSNCMSLHQWFLTFKTADKSTQLLTLVNVDPNNVFYFCTNKINKGEAIQWLNKLPNLIRTTFTFNQQCKIFENDDKDPIRSYREAAPAEHTSDAVSGFDKLLKGAMDMVNNEEKDNTPATDKDHLSNCW
eukprot:8253198-Ditylum_brightwellii.AAC.1